MTSFEIFHSYFKQKSFSNFAMPIRADEKPNNEKIYQIFAHGNWFIAGSKSLSNIVILNFCIPSTKPNQ